MTTRKRNPFIRSRKQSLQLYVSPDELAAWQAYARACGESVSGAIRRIGLELAQVSRINVGEALEELGITSAEGPAENPFSSASPAAGGTAPAAAATPWRRAVPAEEEGLNPFRAD